MSKVIIHTMEYYSVIWKNKLLIHTTFWMNLQRIILCEKKSQPWKLTSCMIPVIQHSWNEKIIVMEKKISGFQRLRMGEGQKGGGCVYKKTTWEIPVVIEMFCILVRSMPISLLWYYTIVLQDVTIEGNRVKFMQDHFVLFLRTACESKVILK